MEKKRLIEEILGIMIVILILIFILISINPNFYKKNFREIYFLEKVEKINAGKDYYLESAYEKERTNDFISEKFYYKYFYFTKEAYLKNSFYKETILKK